MPCRKRPAAALHDDTGSAGAGAGIMSSPPTRSVLAKHIDIRTVATPLSRHRKNSPQHGVTHKVLDIQGDSAASRAADAEDSTALPSDDACASTLGANDSESSPSLPACSEYRPGYIPPATDDPLWDLDPGHDKVLARFVAGLPCVFNLGLLSTRMFYQRGADWGTWEDRKERAFFALRVGRDFGLWSYYALAPNRYHFWVRHSTLQLPKFDTHIRPLLLWAGHKLAMVEAAVTDTRLRHDSLRRLEARLRHGDLRWELTDGTVRQSLQLGPVQPVRCQAQHGG